MADVRHQIPTGGKGDLQVDISRCLQMRYSESSCRCCTDICPHRAISLDGILSINPHHCTGCLLCTAVCPSGALEQNSDFQACLVQLSRVPEPIMGCIRTKEHSNAALACLGGLSEEHLVALCHSLSGKVTLNLTACSDCPNHTKIPQLHKRLDAIREAGLSGSTCRIVMAHSAQEINYRDESVDRRSFFRAFGNSVFKSATVILSTTIEQADRRIEYAGKRLPVRRELLNRARKNLSPELEVLVRRHFDASISFDHNCTNCQGCAAICPTGALKAEQSDIPPTFDSQLCTRCGLCREFCLEGALQISTGKSEE